MEIFNCAEIELNIITAASNTLPQEELTEEEEMFLQLCSQGISLGLIIFGRKEKNKCWHPSPDGKSHHRPAQHCIGLETLITKEKDPKEEYFAPDSTAYKKYLGPCA